MPETNPLFLRMSSGQDPIHTCIHVDLVQGIQDGQGRQSAVGEPERREPRDNGEGPGKVHPPGETRLFGGKPAENETRKHSGHFEEALFRQRRQQRQQRGKTCVGHFEDALLTRS